MLKDMIALAVYTTAIDRLTRAARKNGVDADDVAGIFDAVHAKHFPDLPPVVGIGFFEPEKKA